MFIKSSVDLIYEGQSVAANGSPKAVTLSETVKCDEMETFSNNYYNDQQRNMRLSKNLVLPSYLTVDRQDDEGINYELMYCDYQGKRYKVKNILKLRGTRQRMILDIQEVR
jgi:hypothetical protein